MLTQFLLKSVHVKVAETEAEREALYRLRYQISVKELGKDCLSGVDHDKAWIRNPEDDWPEAVQLYVEHHGEITATFRLILGSSRIAQEPLIRSYGVEDFAPFDVTSFCFGHGSVARPDRRGSLAVAAMFIHAFHISRKAGLLFNCCSIQASLIPHYLSLGWRMYRPSYQLPEGGLRIPVVLVANDINHLNEIDSPLSGVASDYPGDPESIAAFRRVAKNYQTINQKSLGQFEPGSVFEDLHETQMDIFSESEGAELVKRGCLLRFGPGESLIQMGTRERDFFVVLDGAFEVLISPEDPTPICIITAGDVIGEMAYFLDHQERTATVRALMPSRVVVVRQRVVDKWMDDSPKLAAKLFHLTSSVLARRLHFTTRQYLLDHPHSEPLATDDTSDTGSP